MTFEREKKERKKGRRRAAYYRAQSGAGVDVVVEVALRRRRRSCFKSCSRDRGSRSGSRPPRLSRNASFSPFFLFFSFLFSFRAYPAFFFFFFFFRRTVRDACRRRRVDDVGHALQDTQTHTHAVGTGLHQPAAATDADFRRRHTFGALRRTLLVLSASHATQLSSYAAALPGELCLLLVANFLLFAFRLPMLLKRQRRRRRVPLISSTQLFFFLLYLTLVYFSRRLDPK